jgi:hypothetical protein
MGTRSDVTREALSDVYAGTLHFSMPGKGCRPIIDILAHATTDDIVAAVHADAI